MQSSCSVAITPAHMGLQEPVFRCFEEAGEPDARLSPQAATALLGGVMFSLVFSRDGDMPGSANADLPADLTERARLAVRMFLYGYWALARGEIPPSTG